MGKSIFRRKSTPPVAASDDRPALQPARKVGGLFKALVNTRLWRSTKQAPTYAGEVTRLNREVFTPTQPKTCLTDFIGRADSIAGITQSIEEEQAHVLLLGRRGLGKTSILNVVAEAAADAGFLVARVACTRDLTFDDFLRTIFEDLSRHAAEAAAGDALLQQIGVEQLTDLIDDSPHNVQTALRAFNAISSQRLLVLIDDFHLVRDETLRDRLADLMGALSDGGAKASMIIAARGKEEQPSVFGREEEPSGTVTVSLDPMQPDEIADILRRGGGRLGVHFGEDVLQSIVLLCQGIPAIAQWLGLLVSRRVLHRYGDTADMQDVVAAATDAAARIDPYICDRLDNAASARKSAADLDDVVYLAARVGSGAEDSFSPADINREAAFLGTPPYPEASLHRLLTRQSQENEPLLEKLTVRNGSRYRFADPQVPAIVMLRNAHRERPSDGDVLNAYLLHQSLSLPKPSADREDDFRNWLRFVLAADEAAWLVDREADDPTTMTAFGDRFRHADGAEDLAALLRDIRDFLSARDDTEADPGAPFEESAA